MGLKIFSFHIWFVKRYCNPLKYIVNLGFTPVYNDFSGLQYTLSPSQLYVIYIIMHYWKYVSQENTLSSSASDQFRSVTICSYTIHAMCCLYVLFIYQCTLFAVIYKFKPSELSLLMFSSLRHRWPKLI